MLFFYSSLSKNNSALLELIPARNSLGNYSKPNSRLGVSHETWRR